MLIPKLIFLWRLLHVLPSCQVENYYSSLPFPMKPRLPTTFLHCCQHLAVLFCFSPVGFYHFLSLPQHPACVRDGLSLSQDLLVLNCHRCFCNFTFFLGRVIGHILTLYKSIFTSGQRWSMLVWTLLFDLSSMQDPIRRACTLLTLFSGVTETHKPPRHKKDWTLWQTTHVSWSITTKPLVSPPSSSFYVHFIYLTGMS